MILSATMYIASHNCKQNYQFNHQKFMTFVKKKNNNICKNNANIFTITFVKIRPQPTRHSLVSACARRVGCGRGLRKSKVQRRDAARQKALIRDISKTMKHSQKDIIRKSF